MPAFDCHVGLAQTTGAMVENLSYLATFVSLIYGLAAANVLAHFAQLIKRGRQADWYWVHTVWALYLLLMMASFWWVLQIWASVPRIGYLNYLGMLLIPSLLFVISEILFPERNGETTIDLKAHFFRIKKPMFLLFIGIVLADEIDSLEKGWSHVLALGPYYWGSQLFWIASSVVGIRSGSDRVQGGLVSLSILVFIGGMINALAKVA